MSGLTYTKIGDYLIPDLAMDGEDDTPLGKYGMLRETFLQEHPRHLHLNAADRQIGTTSARD